MCLALPRKSHVSRDPIKEKSPENVWGKSLPGSGDNEHIGPVAGIYSLGLGIGKEAAGPDG